MRARSCNLSLTNTSAGAPPLRSQLGKYTLNTTTADTVQGKASLKHLKMYFFSITKLMFTNNTLLVTQPLTLINQQFLGSY